MTQQVDEEAAAVSEPSEPHNSRSSCHHGAEHDETAQNQSTTHRNIYHLERLHNILI